MLVDAAGFLASILGIEAIGWFEDVEGSSGGVVVFGVTLPRKDEVIPCSRVTPMITFHLLDLAICILDLLCGRCRLPGDHQEGSTTCVAEEAWIRQEWSHSQDVHMAVVVCTNFIICKHHWCPLSVMTH